MLRPGPSQYLFQRLPSNLWFNTSDELNLRYESNIFLSATSPKRDVVFRTFPNLTVGYNFLKNTGVYTNYFLIKDVYADTTPGAVSLTRPTTQSVSLGLRHNRQIRNTNVQFDFQTRELWQNKGLHQFDYIPGMLLSRSLSPHTYGFVNLQMQLRGGTPFVAPTREIDPFYTVGVLRSFGLWTLSVTNTFITNFRDPPFRGSIPQHGNYEMISDIEVYHPVIKRYPNVVAFMRAEPIWNWHSDRVTGLSGFDFRVYSGIRVTFAKPPLGSLVNQMIKEQKAVPTQPDAAPTVPSQPGVSTSDSSIKGSYSARLPQKPNKSPKISLLQRLMSVGSTAGNASDPPLQSPITMIQDPLNPYGPMIPILSPAESLKQISMHDQSSSETHSAVDRLAPKISCDTLDEATTGKKVDCENDAPKRPAFNYNTGTWFETFKLLESSPDALKTKTLVPTDFSNSVQSSILTTTKEAEIAAAYN